MLLPVTQRSFGASEKILKVRMKAVSNIGKITKAMKMVAASKMKGDLTRLENGKNFGYGGVDLMFKADDYMQRRGPEKVAVPNELLVPITSDKGLCGSINSGIFRNVRDYLSKKDHSKMTIFAVGDKGATAMKRPFPHILKAGISQLAQPYNYPLAMAVAEQVIANSEGKDKITVFYNQFISAISFVQRRMELMPRHHFIDTVKFGKLYFKGSVTIPDKNTSCTALYELYITSNLWIAFLNNSVSEQSSRMTAMENASKNSKEILDKLTLQYNYARQARITTELCEIISGASAM